MKLLYALLLAAAGAPLTASAQSDRPAPLPSPLPYHSAFTGYQSTPDPVPPPDQAWRQANRDVAASGHAMGHMHHGAAAHAGMDHEQMRPGAEGQPATGHGAMDHGKMDHEKAQPAKPGRHAGHGAQPKVAKPARQAPQPPHHHGEH